MLAAIGLAIGDLADRAIIGVIVRSLAITLLLFAGLTIALAWGLEGADPCQWVSNGTCTLDAAAGWAGGLALGLAALWFLFPAVAIGVMSNYFDRIMAAVERRHYPDLVERAKPFGVGGNLAFGVGSGVRVLIFNLIALPFYLLLLVTGIGPLVLFVAVNGLALGRDFGKMASRRHLPPAERPAWLAGSRGQRTMLGMAVTGLFLVPVVNLFAPVIGAAAATHLFARRIA